MKGLIYGLLVFLSPISAQAENQSFPNPSSDPLQLGECPTSERNSIRCEATYDSAQSPVAGFGSSEPDGVGTNDKGLEVVDFLGLSKMAAKDHLNLALLKVTDENDRHLLKSTLGALENAEIRMEPSREGTALSCDIEENGFVQFGYPREIFVCNRFINFFPDQNERTVAMAQLLVHEATHLAEIDDGTRIRGTPEGCRATYVETLVTKLTSRNHSLVYRTYDMDRCEKQEQD